MLCYVNLTYLNFSKIPVDTFTPSFPFNSRNQSIPVSPQTPQRSKPALGQRDRSSSAPNVCLINPGEISHEVGSPPSVFLSSCGL